MTAGSLTLGGNLSIALGPLGRNGEALGSLSAGGRLAAMSAIFPHLDPSPATDSYRPSGTVTVRRKVFLEVRQNTLIPGECR